MINFIKAYEYIATDIPDELRLDLADEACPALFEEIAVTGSRSVWEIVDALDWQGWLECTNTVLYRVPGQDWRSASPKDIGSIPPRMPILNGELCGRHDGVPTSLQVRHIHGDEWRLVRIKEKVGAKMFPIFDETFRGIILDDPFKSADDGMRLTYRTYWDVEQGRARHVRFIGFSGNFGETHNA